MGCKMENISKKDISFRIDKIRNKASEINLIVTQNNEELNDRYNFARELGINRIKNNTNEEIIDGLNVYILKAEEILERINKEVDDEQINEEYKILNNMLYLDDIKLKNISELVKENKELSNRVYINQIANKANDLIRVHEIRYIDSNIESLSKKSNFIEKITGKAKIRKALLQNYSLKRAEVVNKKYIPENKSILEIINITKNCGYKSKEIDEFIKKLSDEYNIGDMIDNSLAVINDKIKIPFFFNREFLNKINAENSVMLDRINNKKKKGMNSSEVKLYNEAIMKDVSTLELLNFSNVIEEVV